MSNAEFIVAFVTDVAREKRRDDAMRRRVMGDGRELTPISFLYMGISTSLFLMAQVAGELTPVTPSHLQARTV